jgi:hypothetical protein
MHKSGVGGDEVAGVVSRRKVAITAGSARWSVSIFSGYGKDLCVKHVSGGSLTPAHRPDAEREGMVNRVFRVIPFIFVWGRLLSREAIRAMVLVGRDMHQLEVEKEDGGDPVVDGSIGLDVRIAKHTFNVACIHFDDEIADADEVKVHCA